MAVFAMVKVAFVAAGTATAGFVPLYHWTCGALPLRPSVIFSTRFSVEVALVGCCVMASGVGMIASSREPNTKSLLLLPF